MFPLALVSSYLVLFNFKGPSMVVWHLHTLHVYGFLSTYLSSHLICKSLS